MSRNSEIRYPLASISYGYPDTDLFDKPARQAVEGVKLSNYESGMEIACFNRHDILPEVRYVPVYKDAQDQLNEDRFCRECYQ